MKYKQLRILWTAALFLIGMPAANALTLDLNHVGDSGEIRFNGPNDTFEFVPATSTTPSFNVFASGVNLTGIINGTFAVDVPVDTTKDPFQTADVTGTRTLSLFDTPGDSAIFTADVTFHEIYTVGDGGGLNKLTASANVDNINYSGSGNADLQFLENMAIARLGVTFDLPAGETLESLMNGISDDDDNGIVETISYSGHITAVPIPAAAWLFGSALVGVTVIARRKKSPLPKEMAA